MLYKKVVFFAEAEKVIPGGVNSRSFQSSRGTPIFVESAKGAPV
jgi:glutamate-1-semialdehyde aminotransferase